jgi:F0F1-type ATP synthase alpha subunit
MKTTSSSSKKISSAKAKELDLSSFGIAISNDDYKQLEVPQELKELLKDEKFKVLYNRENGNPFLKGNKGHLLSLSFDSVPDSKKIYSFRELQFVESSQGYKCWRIF